MNNTLFIFLGLKSVRNCCSLAQKFSNLKHHFTTLNNQN